MYQYLTGVRSVLRRLGVLRLVARVRAMPAAWRAWELRRRYEAERPETVDVRSAAGSFRMRVLSAQHYAALLSNREPKIREFLAGRLSPGDTFWDIGANVGNYTLLGALAVGPEGRVWAFEPYPPAASVLRENLELNGFSNVDVASVALGSQPGNFLFQATGGPESGTHHLVPEGGEASGAGEPMRVPVETGDAWRDQGGHSVPNAIKIDVEGAELEVLKGLRETLRSPECHTILVEVHFALLESRGHRRAPVEIGRRLEECGFESLAWLDASHLAARKGRPRRD